MISKKYNKQLGFTLIELLIVIVIIGILAGVVIGGLNPAQQQARARDGTLKASLDKFALGTKALLLTTSRPFPEKAPTTAEFKDGVLGLTDGPTACTSTVTNSNVLCTFTISGQTYGISTCGVSGDPTTTGGTTACIWGYQKLSTAVAPARDGFRVAIKGQALPSKIFVYEYVEVPSATPAVNEGFYACDTYALTSAAYGTAAGSGCTALN